MQPSFPPSKAWFTTFARIVSLSATLVAITYSLSKFEFISSTISSIVPLILELNNCLVFSKNIKSFLSESTKLDFIVTLKFLAVGYLVSNLITSFALFSVVSFSVNVPFFCFPSTSLYNNSSLHFLIKLIYLTYTLNSSYHHQTKF